MKRWPFILSMLFSLLPPPCWAQQETLGRLFLTPEQRTALDRQRLLNPGVSSDSMDSEGSQTLNGEVRRSSGRNTRWINGEPTWNKDIPLPRVPVGDTYYPGTGERESLLGEGRIAIKRPSNKDQKP